MKNDFPVIMPTYNQSYFIRRVIKNLLREEWVSDNLFDLFWRKLIDIGIFTSIWQVTAEWTIHTFQQHHLVNEDNDGGLNRFRQYYNVEKVTVQPIILSSQKISTYSIKAG